MQKTKQKCKKAVFLSLYLLLFIFKRGQYVILKKPDMFNIYNINEVIIIQAQKYVFFSRTE